MRHKTALLLSLAMAMGALGACSKPASETASDAQTAAGAAGGVTAPGGTVSPPSTPQNDAVNTDTNKGETAQTPGSNSFTEGQAKGHIENAGYSEVTNLQKTPDGLWTASAKKDGKSVQVSVDFKGAVSAK